MRKIYYKPTIQVVKVQVKPLLTGSESVPVNSTPVAGGSSDAKGGWSWDDDEPEDYEE